MTTESREQLEAWIAQTKRHQRTLGVVLAAAAAGSVVLAVTVGTVGGFGIVIVVLVAICGFWITGSHLLDWRRKLAALDRANAGARAGKRSDL